MLFGEYRGAVSIIMDGRLPAIGAALELAQCALLSLRFTGFA